MLVYGVGNHLMDMLEWHPDLAGRIERVFDKDSAKIGTKCPGLDIVIEAPESMGELKEGTDIAIAAIRYYAEIANEIRSINPGLFCLDIDDAYRKPEPIRALVLIEQCEDNIKSSKNRIRIERNGGLISRIIKKRLEVLTRHVKLDRYMVVSLRGEIEKVR